MRPHSGVWTRTKALSLKLSRWLGPSTNKEAEGKSDLQGFGPVAVPNCCGPVIHSSIGPGHALPRWLPGLRIYLWISKLNMVTYLVFASYVRPKRNWPDVLREGIGVFAANFCLSLTELGPMAANPSHSALTPPPTEPTRCPQRLLGCSQTCQHWSPPFHCWGQ